VNLYSAYRFQKTSNALIDLTLCLRLFVIISTAIEGECYARRTKLFQNCLLYFSTVLIMVLVDDTEIILMLKGHCTKIRHKWVRL